MRKMYSDLKHKNIALSDQINFKNMDEGIPFETPEDGDGVDSKDRKSEKHTVASNGVQFQHHVVVLPGSAVPTQYGSNGNFGNLRECKDIATFEQSQFKPSEDDFKTGVYINIYPNVKTEDIIQRANRCPKLLEMAY